MTDSSHSGAPPADLTLHTRPRPVRRFNRKVLIGLAALGCALLFGATLAALSPPKINGTNGQELYNTDRKARADGLADLPKSYADLTKPVPPLGPPVHGDLGRPLVNMEREYGIAQAQSPPSGLGFRPDAEADAARAERLRMAQKAQQAREAGVFFQVNARREAAQASAAAQPTQNGSVRPSPAAAPADPSRVQFDLENDQNMQQRKLDFLKQDVDRNIYNPHSLQEPVSPFQVMAGTVIAASLITGLKSDLPGIIVAQVTENAYDTVTGRHLLIPQGARLVGRYDSVVAFGQSRALVVWQRIIMPNGSSIVIDNLPATDTAGYAGLEDEVDYHTWRLLTGIGLSTLLGVGTEVGYRQGESNLVRAIRDATQQSTNRAGQRITERNLNIQPTLTVRPGWPLRVIVHKDLVLREYRG